MEDLAGDLDAKATECNPGCSSQRQLVTTAEASRSSSWGWHLQTVQARGDDPETCLPGEAVRTCVHELGGFVRMPVHDVQAQLARYRLVTRGHVHVGRGSASRHVPDLRHVDQGGDAGTPGVRSGSAVTPASMRPAGDAPPTSATRS